MIRATPFHGNSAGKRCRDRLDDDRIIAMGVLAHVQKDFAGAADV